MAEAEAEKTLTLAEQWSLQKQEEQTEQIVTPLESAKDEKPDDATSEEVVAGKPDEVPAAEESTKTPEQPAQEGEEKQEEQEETEKQEEAEQQDAGEEKPVIKIETAPADFRFPTTNQTRHCFTRYIEYHRCIQAKGEGAPECEKFAKYYRSLCPSEWIERWNEQRENGTFPGPL